MEIYKWLFSLIAFRFLSKWAINLWWVGVAHGCWNKNRKSDMPGQRQNSLAEAKSKALRNPFRRAISMAANDEPGRLIIPRHLLFWVVFHIFLLCFLFFVFGTIRPDTHLNRISLQTFFESTSTKLDLSFCWRRFFSACLMAKLVFPWSFVWRNGTLGFSGL